MNKNEIWLREHKDELIWHDILSSDINLSDDFILELYGQNYFGIYALVTHHKMTKKLILHLINAIEKYDNKFSSHYDPLIFAPIWKNVFNNLDDEDFKKVLFDRYLKHKKIYFSF